MAGFRAHLAQARQRLAHPPVPLQQLASSAGIVEFADGGEGAPVLIIHGNNGGWDQSMDWAQRRLDNGFRAIAPSRFGYLGSTIPDGATLAQQADVLVELLDHLKLLSVAVVSLSAGSMTAAHLAAQHPDRVRVLVLESPVLPTPRPLRQPPAAIFRRLARSGRLFWLTSSLLAAVAKGSGVSWKQLGEPERDELRTIMQTMTPVRPRADGMVFDNLVAYPEIARDEIPWEQIQAPTLVVAARDSPLPKPADVEAILARIPSARALQLATGGHLLLGNIELLRTELASFLTRDHGTG